MTLEGFVEDLLESVGADERATLRKQYGLWDIFERKGRPGKRADLSGRISEQELKGARSAMRTDENRKRAGEFLSDYFRSRYQDDEMQAAKIWNRDSLLEPVLVGGEERAFTPREGIAYRLVSDLFYRGENPFEEKLLGCPGGLCCSTEETRSMVGKWHGEVRSAVEGGGGSVAWPGLFEKFSAAGLVSSNRESRLLQKFMRFSADIEVDGEGNVRLVPEEAGKVSGLSKGLQMYLRARKFPAPFEEIVTAYQMPRWILLACLLGRHDLFTLLPTGEFRLATR